MNFVALEMPIGDRAKYIADIAILTELKPW